MGVEMVMSRGLLQRDDGLCIAKAATLTMSAAQDAQGLGDVRATLSVPDDPMFARRNLRKRFIFVSACDPERRADVFVMDVNGACIAFAVPPRKE